jgi:formylglycine-generating enzyme required for sulfatase activity
MSAGCDRRLRLWDVESDASLANRELVSRPELTGKSTTNFPSYAERRFMGPDRPYEKQMPSRIISLWGRGAGPLVTIVRESPFKKSPVVSDVSTMAVSPDNDLLALAYVQGSVQILQMSNLEANQDRLNSTMGDRELHTNSVGMSFRSILQGDFEMGSSDRDRYAEASEKPKHTVKISRVFYIGIHEVTQQQYFAVMKRNVSHFQPAKREQLPVDSVSWEEAMAFCKALSSLAAEREGRRTYSLPTEAEWEYACRAGTKTIWSWGDDPSKAEEFAWLKGNAIGTTHAVGSLKPNPWGLYDMHGNVWEHISDYGRESPDYEFSGNRRVDPVIEKPSKLRLLRGGSIHHPVESARSAFRDCRYDEHTKFEDFGFRVVMEIKEKVNLSP